MLYACMISALSEHPTSRPELSHGFSRSLRGFSSSTLVYSPLLITSQVTGKLAKRLRIAVIKWCYAEG